MLCVRILKGHKNIPITMMDWGKNFQKEKKKGGQGTRKEGAPNSNNVLVLLFLGSSKQEKTKNIKSQVYQLAAICIFEKQKI